MASEVEQTTNVRRKSHIHAHAVRQKISVDQCRSVFPQVFYFQCEIIDATHRHQGTEETSESDPQQNLSRRLSLLPFRLMEITNYLFVV